MESRRPKPPITHNQRGAGDWISRLAQPHRIEDAAPVAARFIYSLRLIALHERARQDPVPELAVRLGSVNCASAALAFAQAIGAAWPENVQVSHFCCRLMSYDEASIAALVESASSRDHHQFNQVIEGLVRPDRMRRLWDAAIVLIAAESLAARA